jgi:hypothetical protein
MTLTQGRHCRGIKNHHIVDMKKSNILHLTVLACVAAATVFFSGCATTPADRAASMSQNVAQTGKALESSKQMVTSALSILNQMITQPSGDMRSQYKGYLAAVKELKSSSDRLDASIDTMVAGSEIYFADWGNRVSAISDNILRQLSEDRKQQAVATLGQIKADMGKVRAAYKPLVKDLDDVGIYLGNNLTADGIAAMRPCLDAIKVEAVGVRDAITGTVSSLNRFSASLAAPAK